jgi:hypothetical protein
MRRILIFFLLVGALGIVGCDTTYLSVTHGETVHITLPPNEVLVDVDFMSSSNTFWVLTKDTLTGTCHYRTDMKDWGDVTIQANGMTPVSTLDQSRYNQYNQTQVFPNGK